MSLSQNLVKTPTWAGSLQQLIPVSWMLCLLTTSLQLDQEPTSFISFQGTGHFFGKHSKLEQSTSCKKCVVWLLVEEKQGVWASCINRKPLVFGSQTIQNGVWRSPSLFATTRLPKLAMNQLISPVSWHWRKQRKIYSQAFHGESSRKLVGWWTLLGKNIVWRQKKVSAEWEENSPSSKLCKLPNFSSSKVWNLTHLGPGLMEQTMGFDWGSFSNLQKNLRKSLRKASLSLI